MRNQKLEKFLINELPRNEFKARFRERFKNASDDSYWQIMSEMRAIYIFNKKLNIPVVNIEAQTVKNKNVDFTVEYAGEKIYVEVKGFRPIKEALAKKGGWIGLEEEKIDRALNRSVNKFLEKSCNIVVIADENTTKLPLYDNYLTELADVPGTYLNSSNYKKVSSLIILGGMYYEQQYDYKIWYNDNASKILPQRIIEIFDKHKSNSNDKQN